MNENQQLADLLEEVRAMRETQLEMQGEFRAVMAALTKAIGESSFDVRQSISGAAERIVEALERN